MSTEKNNDLSLQKRLDELVKLKMAGNYATLARIAKLSNSTLASIKKGVEPRAKTIMKIAKALGVTSDYLIEGIGEANENSPKTNKRNEKIAEIMKELDENEQKIIMNYIKEKIELKKLREIVKEMQKKRS